MKIDKIKGNMIKDESRLNQEMKKGVANLKKCLLTFGLCYILYGQYLKIGTVVLKDQYERSN